MTQSLLRLYLYNGWQWVSIGYERGDFVEGNVIYLPLHVPLAKALFHRLPVIPAADEGVAYFFFRKGGKEIAENGLF